MTTNSLLAFVWPAITLIILFAIFGKRFMRGQKFISGILVYIASFGTHLAISIIAADYLIDMAMILLSPFLYFYIALRRFRNQIQNTSHPTKENSKKTSDHVISKKTRVAGDSNIFICYRRADSENVAGRIYDRLVQYYGKESIFKDVDSIPLGVDFRTFLDGKVGQCKVLLVVIGDQWVSIADTEGNRRLDDFRDYVRIEIESALKRNVPVIPLLVRRATMPEEEFLPESIKGLAFRNGIQIRPDPDFHNDMERLISALDTSLN